MTRRWGTEQTKDAGAAALAGIGVAWIIVACVVIGALNLVALAQQAPPTWLPSGGVAVQFAAERIIVSPDYADDWSICDGPDRCVTLEAFRALAAGTPEPAPAPRSFWRPWRWGR